jgi:glycosyltransferase involved in cell wall biosynthesis
VTTTERLSSVDEEAANGVAPGPTWHVITCEYPPRIGGVAGYTRRLARALASAAREVHVWCPAEVVPPPADAGVTVHALPAPFTRSGLRGLDRALDAAPAPRRLLVQWVPHGYSARSLNLRFCRWVLSRGTRGDRVEVMVHEPFLAFLEGSWKQDAAALVHRLMMATLLRRAAHVWVSIPSWARAVRPYVPRGVPVTWLPVTSTIEQAHDPVGVGALRSALAPGDALLFGHFGTFGTWMRGDLLATVPRILRSVPHARLLFLGRDSNLFAAELVRALPWLAGRIHGTGILDDSDVSRHLQACDVMLQPYADGASSRRCSLLAALAHGCPTVTTVGRASETLWRDTPAVAAALAGDRDAFVAAATTLAADAARRARMAAAARALYAERFTIERTAATLLSAGGRPA